jgi:hypothetical protein
VQDSAQRNPAQQNPLRPLQGVNPGIQISPTAARPQEGGSLSGASFPEGMEGPNQLHDLVSPHHHLRSRKRRWTALAVAGFVLLIVGVITTLLSEPSEEQANLPAQVQSKKQQLAVFSRNLLGPKVPDEQVLFSTSSPLCCCSSLFREYDARISRMFQTVTKLRQCVACHPFRHPIYACVHYASKNDTCRCI